MRRNVNRMSLLNRLPMRAACAALLAWALLSRPAGPAVAQERPRQPPLPAPPASAPLQPAEAASVTIDGPTRLAIDRALDFLYRSQNRDGSWTDRVGRKVHNYYRGQVAPHVGVTALAGIAFLSSGNLPNQGPRERYCEAVRKALDFIMENTGLDGFISANKSRMYSHAFATLFLAEAHGTSLHPDAKRLERCLKSAIALIVKSQNEQGGWRYMPGATDADMSITVCQVMALRAARNAGIKVPKETIQRAIDYVKKSFDTQTGGYKYQIEPESASFRHRSTFPLTACGLAALYGAGEYHAPEIREGLRYLLVYRPGPQLARHRFDYFYGHYYAVQAAFQAGGAYWERWYAQIREDLLSIQEPDGSWSELVGPNYATAMAAIILQMPNRYLPITEN